MKKLTVTLVAIFISLALWLSLSQHESPSPPAMRAEVSKTKPTTSSEVSTGQVSTTQQAKTEADEDAALEAASRAERARELQEDEARARREYSTQIEFYGLVIDQFDAPVPNARVEYDSVGGSFEGDRELLADTQGRFTITGIRGKRLRIRVTHAGYYNNDLGSSYYVYAGNYRGPNFKPDPANPVIFRLRKKGEAAELVHRHDRVRFDGDEPERSFSLYDHSRRRDQPEYVILRRVETAERDNRGQPIRRLEMEVPDGGIQQRMDPFAFIAPDDGYQTKMYFMRTPGRPLDYFVKFPNGNYGRFTIMGSAGDYLIDSYLNPDRSPNLEYDIEKEITVPQTGRMGVDLVYPASAKPLPKTPQPVHPERPRKSLHELRREPPVEPAPPPG